MDCDNLRIGQKLCVEVDLDRSEDFKDYRIKRGDTCKSVAKKLNTTVQILKNINNCKLLYIYYKLIQTIFN